MANHNTPAPTVAAVKSILPVARTVRRIMAQRPECDELSALAYLAETNAVLYEQFARAIKRNAVFARMTLSDFVERRDSLKSAGTVAA